MPCFSPVDCKAPSCFGISVDDSVIEYWAGNPSVEIAHGHIYATAGPAARAVLSERTDIPAGDGTALPAATPSPAPATSSSASASASPSPPPPCAGSCVALASSVPCYMSAPEFCDFVGAFGDETHRLFRHCRVLHGRSPEEYLMTLWLTSPEAAAALIEQLDGRRYNALEAGVCRLHRVVGCLRWAPSEKEAYKAGSPNVLACKRSQSSSSTAPVAGSPGAGALRSPVPQHAAAAPAGAAAAARLLGSGASPLRAPCGSPPLPRTGSPPNMPPLQLEASQLTSLGFPEEELFCAASQQGPASASEPFCAVCLEQIEANPGEYQLTELGGGVPLTILCGHTFHARCLARWCDSTCPVCRFQQHPDQTSCCDVCGQSEGIHICLVCSFIGCINQEGEGHAKQHFEATSHAYALEVSTQRVWDYAGNGYVHRLLYNHEDGKMVEHSVPPASPSGAGGLGFGLGSDAAAAAAGAAGVGAGGGGGGDGAPPGPAAAAAVAAATWQEEADGLWGPDAALARGDGMRAGARPGAKKQESVVAEFNALLASQMTAQRRYFEERQKEQEHQHQRELGDLEAHLNVVAAVTTSVQAQLDAAAEANRAIERDIADVSASEELMRRQLQQLEALNKKISSEQREFEAKVENQREEQRQQRRSGRQEVEDLQQQIRDLELYVQMRKKLEKSTDEADRQGSHVFVTESDQPARGRGGRRHKRR